MIKSFKTFEGRNPLSHDLSFFNESKVKKTVSFEEEVESAFSNAQKNSPCSVNLDYLGGNWSKYSDKYFIYDNIYVYNGCVYSLITRDSGDWYSTTLQKSKMPMSELRKFIDSKMDELEKAQHKLYNIDL